MKKENNMMWTRFELKERGKAAFQRNYWRSVLVAFILMLFVSGGGSAVSNSWNQITSSGTSDDSYYTEYFDDGDLGHFYYNSGTSIPGMLVSGIIAVVVGGVMIVSALLGIFLFNPLEVGGCRFFMENSEYQPTVGRLGFAFQKGMYGKTVLTLFLRKLFIGLWSLLLIVPGIVKAYEYRMVPYLLADDPNKTGCIPPQQRTDVWTEVEYLCAGSFVSRMVPAVSVYLWTAGNFLCQPICSGDKCRAVSGAET